MGMNLGPTPGHTMTYYPQAVTLFNTAGTTSGWVDTDVSAHTGTDTKKIWVVICGDNNGSEGSGVRTRGSAVSSNPIANKTHTQLVTVNSSGHVDLLDGTIALQYRFTGYLL